MPCCSRAGALLALHARARKKPAAAHAWRRGHVGAASCFFRWGGHAKQAEPPLVRSTRCHAARHLWAQGCRRQDKALRSRPRRSDSRFAVVRRVELGRGCVSHGSPARRDRITRRVRPSVSPWRGATSPTPTSPKARRCSIGSPRCFTGSALAAERGARGSRGGRQSEPASATPNPRSPHVPWLQATGGASGHGQRGASSRSKSLEYWSYERTLMAAFSQAHE